MGAVGGGGKWKNTKNERRICGSILPLIYGRRVSVFSYCNVETCPLPEYERWRKVKKGDGWRHSKGPITSLWWGAGVIKCVAGVIKCGLRSDMLRKINEPISQPTGDFHFFGINRWWIFFVWKSKGANDVDGNRGPWSDGPPRRRPRRPRPGSCGSSGGSPGRTGCASSSAEGATWSSWCTDLKQTTKKQRTFNTRQFYGTDLINPIISCSAKTFCF